MKKQKTEGLFFNGSFRRAGVTVYSRAGKTIVRTSHSEQPQRRTPAQFDVRMRTKHSAALWGMLKDCGEVHFYGEGTAYSRFRAQAFRLAPVYTKKDDHFTLLMPGLPVSEGTLPSIKEHLGTHDGAPALITNLKKGDLKKGESLLLFTATQETGGNNVNPACRIVAREVAPKDLVQTKDGLALVGDEFADTMKGWALTRLMRPWNNNIAAQCSTQGIVTNCKFFERYTSPEALKSSLESYGGVKEK